MSVTRTVPKSNPKKKKNSRDIKWKKYFLKQQLEFRNSKEAGEVGNREGAIRVITEMIQKERDKHIYSVHVRLDALPSKCLASILHRGYFAMTARSRCACGSGKRFKSCCMPAY
jgi:uncharacterized protein YchJ